MGSNEAVASLTEDPGRLALGMASSFWLGREDSNLRMVESKSTALPLGDAPTAVAEFGAGGPARIPSGTEGL